MLLIGTCHTWNGDNCTQVRVALVILLNIDLWKHIYFIALVKVKGVIQIHMY